MTPYLELKNISKDFKSKKGSKTALKNINLRIKEKEFLTILGPSGCGKSTLLKIIAGFIKNEKGKVIKQGNIIKEAGLDRIMLFQNFEQLFSRKKVIDNVLFAIKAAARFKNKKLKNKEAKAEALKYLKEVKLKEYKDYYPHQLSGGMKQRVALARTLAAGGEIMLMDEPFASVDSQTRRKLQQLLIDIFKEEERTVIFVTHNIREAVFLSDRIVVMKNEPGEIVEIVDNNLPRPRNFGSKKFNQLYQKLEARI